MTDLRPCPFCGSTEIYAYEPTMYEMGNDASVNCENPICGAEVRGCTLKEAIAKWNRRMKE
jgi:Lar family restriction alleviation protein